MIPRRGFLAGLGALLAAPAIIRTPGLLMPVRPLPLVVGIDGAPPGGDFTSFVVLAASSVGSSMQRYQWSLVRALDVADLRRVG